MNWIDIFVFISLLIGVVTGLKNGFFIELASIAGVLLGFYLADRCTFFAIDLFSITGQYAFEVVYIILIVMVMVLVGLLAKALTGLFSIVCLGLVNRIAGGVAGAFKTILVLSLLARLLNIDFVGESTLLQSYSYSKLVHISDKVYPYLEESVHKTVDYFKEKTDD